MVSINQHDRSWGPTPRQRARFGGGESDPAGLCVWMTPPTALPARPINWLSLFFFFAASLGGRSDPAPEPYFSHMFGANFNWLNANCWREFSNGLSSAPPVWVGVTGRPNLSTPPDTRRRLVKGLWGCSVIPSYKLHKCATVQVWSCTGYIDALMVVM